MAMALDQIECLGAAIIGAAMNVTGVVVTQNILNSLAEARTQKQHHRFFCNRKENIKDNSGGLNVEV